mmetsp:Transcript_8968/g.31735  ORF Transcript_8968/g.31735 Transcript_8968/m.31735 type:complete len:108 (+) Transcript_8968:1571-1894(+)
MVKRIYQQVFQSARSNFVGLGDIIELFASVFALRSPSVGQLHMLPPDMFDTGIDTAVAPAAARNVTVFFVVFTALQGLGSASACAVQCAVAADQMLRAFGKFCFIEG